MNRYIVKLECVVMPAFRGEENYVHSSPERDEILLSVEASSSDLAVRSVARVISEMVRRDVLRF